MENSTGKNAYFPQQKHCKIIKKRWREKQRRDLKVNQQDTMSEPQLDLNSNKLEKNHDI